MGSDSLTILQVTENDKGTYTCIMNTTLDQDSASAELTVVGKDTLSSSSCRSLVSGKKKEKHTDIQKVYISLAKDHSSVT